MTTQRRAPATFGFDLALAFLVALVATLVSSVTSSPSSVPTASAASPFYKVAYGSRGFPNGAQYLVSPDGSNHRYFAGATGQGDFDWTPDGLKNVYVYTSSGSGTSTLFVRNQNDDLFPIDIPDDSPSAPAISNDGERIVYTHRGADNIYYMRVVDLEGNELADLGAGEGPTWSPDGTKIAFMRYGDYSYECGGAGGSGQGRGLASIPATGGSSTWIVEAGQRFDGGYVDNVSSPDWSPDGTTIAFDARINRFQKQGTKCVGTAYSDVQDVFTVPSSGGDPTNLTGESTWGYPGRPFDGNPSFSPDGEQLAFASSRNQAENGLIHTLWVMDAGGGNQTEIYEPVGQVDSTDWTTALPEGAVVRINATDPVATEAGETPGAFTIERTSLLNGDVDITVRVASSSTATQGTDFPAIPTKIRIPDGSATATLIVFPTDDATAEADEKITVEIVDASGYLIGEPSEATITIIDDDSSGPDGPDPDGPDPDGPDPDETDAVPPLTSQSPGRILDTRESGDTVDGSFQAGGLLDGGSMLTLPVAGRAGVSDDADAVVMNVTAIGPTGRGYLSIFPCGEQPLASSLNYGAAGAVVGNEVVAKLSPEGDVCIYTSAATHLTADVVGEVPAGSALTSLDPARLLDSRSTGETVDGVSQRIGRVGAGETIQVQIAGRGGVDPEASAAILNLTAITPEGRGFVTMFPCGDLPLASSLNYGEAGAVVGNEVIAKLSADGTVCVFTSASTDLTIDATGFIPSGTAATSTDPARVLDTRATGETIDGDWQRTGRLTGGETIEVPVAGRGEVPAGAASAVMNVTAINPEGRGFATVYPCDEQPLASSLNYGAAGAVVGNEIIAKLSSDGSVCLYTSAATDLTIDVTGHIDGASQ